MGVSYWALFLMVFLVPVLLVSSHMSVNLKSQFSAQFSHKRRTVTELRTGWPGENRPTLVLNSLPLIFGLVSFFACKFVFICANKTKHLKLGVLHTVHMEISSRISISYWFCSALYTKALETFADLLRPFYFPIK